MLFSPQIISRAPGRSGTGGGGGGGGFATFDGVVTGGTLSGGNLTYTHTTGNGLARSTAQKNSGKWYYEITAVSGITTGGSNSCVAVIKSAATDSDVILSGLSGGIVFKGSAIFANDVNTSLNINTGIADGDIIGVAVDLDNDKVWFRRSPSGNWNGQAIGSQNPVGNVGGGSLSNYSATTMAPAAGFDNTGGVWTANFGASAFTGTVPSGFTSGWTA
jgi:hypothetical protein